MPVCDKLKDKMKALQEREDLMVAKLAGLKDRLASTIRETNILEVRSIKTQEQNLWIYCNR